MAAQKLPIISLTAGQDAVEGSKGWFNINVTGGEIGPAGLTVQMFSRAMQNKII